MTTSSFESPLKSPVAKTLAASGAAMVDPLKEDAPFG
jgi:hypothetical protein